MGLALSRHGVERPVSAVPVPVMLVFALALAAQIGWHLRLPPPVARASALPAPPATLALRGMSFGEEPAFARALMLWLQAFDNQPGISVPFRNLDYRRVVSWLDRILALDPRSRYPLLSAARIYADVPDPDRRRIMIAFVERQFLLAPDTRWPWLAHAVFIARHRLNDLPLALRLARELREYTQADQVPGWARQMEMFVLEAMGETESAKVLLGGLLESGQISDPAEREFLLQRLGE
ncbi:MAG: hypothetical protein HYR49_09460 [Gammaproteobacteria bacterium]|nr:hypothetical protein [Gammaproteobacteria bacterium]